MSEYSTLTFLKSLLSDEYEKKILDLISKNYDYVDIIDILLEIKEELCDKI